MDHTPSPPPAPKNQARWRSNPRLFAVAAAALALQVVIVAIAVGQVGAAREAEEAARAEKAGAQAALEDVQTELSDVNYDLGVATDSLEDLEGERSALSGRVEDAERQVRKLQAQVTQLKRQLKQATTPPAPSDGGGGTSQTCPQDHFCYTITSTGSSSVDVTYTNRSGGTSQAIGAGLPWFLDLGDGYNIDFFYVSGQQSASGTVTCTIWDGKSVYEKGSSTGQYSICTASD